MMKKAVPYLIFPVVIILMLVLYSFSVGRNQEKVINDIEVEFREGDNYFLTHNMVDKLLIQNGSSVRNQPKSLVDLHELESIVSNDPFVEEATVCLTPRGLLKTHIKQREPIARLLDKNGSFYIDKFGVKMPMSSNFSARVPLVSGIDASEDIEKLKELMFFIQEDEFLTKEIVAVEKRGKDFMLMVRSGTYKINFGDITAIDTKFKKLKAFYNKALKDKTIEKYKEINVKYRNQVVCIKQHQDGEQ